MVVDDINRLVQQEGFCLTECRVSPSPSMCISFILKKAGKEIHISWFYESRYDYNEDVGKLNDLLENLKVW